MALIGLTGSLLSLAGVGFSLVWSRRAESQARTQAAALEDWKAGRDAEREYEYEARKRLYHELQPLLFQLREASESAYGRIANLAKASQRGDLESAQTGWLSEDLYRLTTVYRLVVPAVYVRLIRGRLTSIDLNLDASLRADYEVAKLIVSTWNDGHELADSAPPVDYNGESDPTIRGLEEEAGRARQHLVRAQLDLAVEALIRNEGEERRCLEVAEFIEAWRNDSAGLGAAVEPVEALFLRSRQSAVPFSGGCSSARRSSTPSFPMRSMRSPSKAPYEISATEKGSTGARRRITAPSRSRTLSMSLSRPHAATGLEYASRLASKDRAPVQKVSRKVRRPSSGH